MIIASSPAPISRTTVTATRPENTAKQQPATHKNVSFAGHKLPLEDFNGITAIVGAPFWLVYGGYKLHHVAQEKKQFSQFVASLNRLSPAHLNIALQQDFPPTIQGDRDLHKRLRWLAKAFAQKPAKYEALFEKALQQSRVKDILRNEDRKAHILDDRSRYARYEETDKRTLVEKIRKHQPSQFSSPTDEARVDAMVQQLQTLSSPRPSYVEPPFYSVSDPFPPPPPLYTPRENQ